MVGVRTHLTEVDFLQGISFVSVFETDETLLVVSVFETTKRWRGSLVH